MCGGPRCQDRALANRGVAVPASRVVMVPPARESLRGRRRASTISSAAVIAGSVPDGGSAPPGDQPRVILAQSRG